MTPVTMRSIPHASNGWLACRARGSRGERPGGRARSGSGRRLARGAGSPRARPTEGVRHDARSRRLRGLKRAIDEGLDHIPGRVIVKFQDGVSTRPKSRRSAASRAPASRRRRAFADFDLVEIAPEVDPAEAAAAIATQPGVEYAEPDGLRFVSFRPNDPSLRAPVEHDGDQDGAGLGHQPGRQQRCHRRRARHRRRVRDRHLPPAALLQRRAAHGRCAGRRRARSDAAEPLRRALDFIWDDNDPVDFDGHGTHVAGTIGESTNNNSGSTGMAFNVQHHAVEGLRVGVGHPVPVRRGDRLARRSRLQRCRTARRRKRSAMPPITARR